MDCFFYTFGLMKKIIIINGPNLNLLGIREPSIYGNSTFDDFLAKLRSEFSNITIDYFQSNSESELIDKVHQTENNYDAIIINPGGLTHTSVSLADALKSVNTIAIEVHISDITNREAFRKQSITFAGCNGMVAGLGLDSYKLALEHIIDLEKQ